MLDEVLSVTAGVNCKLMFMFSVVSAKIVVCITARAIVIQFDESIKFKCDSYLENAASGAGSSLCK